jgi:hypothetical protein
MSRPKNVPVFCLDRSSLCLDIILGLGEGGGNMSQENGTSNQENKPIASLWKNQSKAGQTYYSGYWKDAEGNEQKVVLFSNGFKRDGKRDPDLLMYKSKPFPAEGKQADQSQQTDLFAADLPF